MDGSVVLAEILWLRWRNNIRRIRMNRNLSRAAASSTEVQAQDMKPRYPQETVRTAQRLFE